MPAAPNPSTHDGLSTHDGRVVRREHNREAVVDAIVTLVNGGDYAPSISKVAKEAGVSERSIFRHFENLEVLYAAVVARQVTVWLSIVRGVGPEGPLAERIKALVAERGRLYEAITPMRKASQRFADDSTVIPAEWAAGRRLLRRGLETTFAPELDRCSGADRRDLLTAVDVATSWASWNFLREQERCSVARAGRVIGRTLEGLLGRP